MANAQERRMNAGMATEMPASVDEQLKVLWCRFQQNTMHKKEKYTKEWFFFFCKWKDTRKWLRKKIYVQVCSNLKDERKENGCNDF